MLKLLLSRLATALPSIVGVVVVTFMLTRLLPGDPAAYFAGLAASPQAIAEIRTKLGLDKSLPEQFVAYLVDLAQGDLGNSLSTGQPVVTEIATRLPASAELTLVALILAVGIAIPLGVLAAVKQGTWIDHLCRIVDHGRRVAAGVLHRAAVRLRLLLPAAMGAGAAAAGSTSSCRRPRTSPAST